MQLTQELIETLRRLPISSLEVCRDGITCRVIWRDGPNTWAVFAPDWTIFSWAELLIYLAGEIDAT